MRAILVIASILLSLPAAAGVTVVFPGKARDTDAGATQADAQRNRGEIGRHLESLGARYLRPDQNLLLEVLDVNLAGRVHYGASDVRVMRAGDWPRIRIRYQLETPGEALLGGEELVSDHDYLRGPQNSLDSLAREKRMLDEWFRERFAKGYRP